MPVKYTSSTVLTLHCHRMSAPLSGCRLHPVSQTTTAGTRGWEGHESAKNLENNCYVIIFQLGGIKQRERRCRQMNSVNHLGIAGTKR